ncbi:unnamed protein product [Zymoseptoria tritici ST99CH_1A5]|uniref:MYND-type domain-containing protein n=1 Tax=Zymoseptoria tritici ST99CH_1A5 TaxID=1276529 RepID=A0A1Y6LTU4_ZYMTR|nr:unnamed protein product [Zymoseptoria tritici ST99CH_1A5]
MNTAERARLIKLGNLAIHHIEKQRLCLDEALQGKDRSAETLTCVKINLDAQRLFALAELLGEKDGSEFVRQAKTAAGILLLGWQMKLTAEEATSLCNHYKQRATIEYAPDDVLRFMETQTPFDANSLPEDPKFGEAIVAWNSEFLRAPGADKKPKCHFCGEHASSDQKLMVCGSCKTPVYCDRTCQKMRWKKGHKAECQAKPKRESKEVEGGDA